MKFKSIQDLVGTIDCNSKVLDCLGRSGALNNLDDDLNEIEAAEYAKGLLGYSREEKDYQSRKLKYDEAVRTKEEKFREKVEARRIKQEAKEVKYQERLKAYNERLIKVREQNAIRASDSKKLLKEPEKPAEPVQLKAIEYPKFRKEPVPPKKLSKPRMTLSNRERIKLQKEMLYIYLSGHPLDEVIKKDRITEIKDLSEFKKGARATIYGVVQSIKVINTRTKKLMGKIRLEDKTGSIEVVLFPKMYEQVKDILFEDRLYEITGRVDITIIEKENSDEDNNENNISYHIQFIGMKVKEILLSSDKEWDLIHKLLSGSIRVLPGKIQKLKSLADSILNKETKIEEKIG
jgi:DNA polymerase III alpha subunit